MKTYEKTSETSFKEIIPITQEIYHDLDTLKLERDLCVQRLENIDEKIAKGLELGVKRKSEIEALSVENLAQTADE